ncbi:hypothetical protein AJ79_05571 [Helicocarpus griseus UAMH5409]|uniref:Multiple myeloma tumor-associated protein 2-like N-terminal domain-containing protein n=1 Tax=Helicocarpus griseus UAMH5409 TaxID=1447875 RepID=A0A2B7XLY1_9EURO|nr:hypothetical protein AJ79_05571 [Helicocarpus griseus UAMH5409]
MDLVASIRKEGSRGGRDSFKWSDVKESTHRENYLGHSLMAPVGRWQQNRDLSWYAKADREGESTEDAAARRQKEREEEIKRIKEAEQEALARALGLPVAPKSASSNANLMPLGGKEVERAVKEAGEGEKEDEAKGVGFGGFRGMGGMEGGDQGDTMEGTGLGDTGLERRAREGRERRGDGERRRDRSRGRDRGRRDRKSQRREYDDDRHARRRHRSRSTERDREPRERRRHRSRSGDRDYYKRQRAPSRSRSRERKRASDERHPRRERSRSPADRRSHHRHRRYDDDRRR